MIQLVINVNGFLLQEVLKHIVHLRHVQLLQLIHIQLNHNVLHISLIVQLKMEVVVLLKLHVLLLM